MSRLDRPDIYTLLIAALIPSMLLAAWGLNTINNVRVHNQQCEVAEEWLTEAAGISHVYTNAGTLGEIEPWLSQLEEFNYPRHASELRHQIDEAGWYGLTWRWNTPTDEPGSLIDVAVSYDDEINQEIDEFIEYCPDTAQMLPDAFPMLFPNPESVTNDD